MRMIIIYTITETYNALSLKFIIAGASAPKCQTASAKMKYKCEARARFFRLLVFHKIRPPGSF